MSTPTPDDATLTQDGAVNQWDTEMATLAFSRALRFTRELTFGVLAVVGCAIVQCLIISWLLSCVVQTNFVLLQARLLCRVYGGSIEILSSAKAESFAPTKNETAPSSSRPPSPVTSIENPGKEPSIPCEPVELATPDKEQPKEDVVLETTNWQTTSLTSRRTGPGRPHAIKQVDIPIPTGLAPSTSGNECSQAVKQTKISVPPGFDHHPLENTCSYAVKRVAPRIPPGFGPQRPPTKVVSEQYSIETPVTAHNDGGSIISTSFYTGNDVKTSSAADQLFSSAETVVRLPSEGPDATIRATCHNKVEPMEIFSGTQNYALVQDGKNSAGRTRIAKRSAIRKVAEPAAPADQVLDHPTNQAPENTTKADIGKHAIPAIMSNVAATDFQPNLRTTRVNHSSIKPATLEELRHKFVDTSLLRRTSCDSRPRTPPREVFSPLSQEEAAREALRAAFSERETSRVNLNTGYTHERALEFDEKARAYKEKRQDLMACMPWGELSEADEQAFPYLSTNDTVAPQVNEPVATGSPRPAEPSLLPSPPSSSEEDTSPLPPREDPTPIIAKASKAYQVLLKFTQNKSEVCPVCKSRFCHQGYTGASKVKLKMARDLYLKIRSSLMDVYGGHELPEEVAKQAPGIVEC